MRKLKAIWRILFSYRYVVYTSKLRYFGVHNSVGYDRLDTNIEEDESGLIVCSKLIDGLIEADEAIQYTKSLLTEI